MLGETSATSPASCQLDIQVLRIHRRPWPHMQCLDRRSTLSADHGRRRLDGNSARVDVTKGHLHPLVHGEAELPRGPGPPLNLRLTTSSALRSSSSNKLSHLHQLLERGFLVAPALLLPVASGAAFARDLPAVFAALLAGVFSGWPLEPVVPGSVAMAELTACLNWSCSRFHQAAAFTSGAARLAASA